jgi:hypothetical protein
MVAALITLVIYLIVVGVILWLLRYLVNTIPMEEPFKRVANIVIVVVGVLIIIVLLLNFVGLLDAGIPRLGH